MRPLIRAMNAIRSCKTRDQLIVAEKYAGLALKTMPPEIRRSYSGFLNKTIEYKWRTVLR